MANPNIAQASWYHGRIDRPTTEAVLSGKKAGTFLVRDSSTCKGDYVLSVSENSKVSHYIITRKANCYVIGDQTFDDIPSVIEFYRRHFLDTTTLVEMAPRVVDSIQPPFSAQVPIPAAAPSTAQKVTRLRGKYDFNSDDPEDLNFKKGDIMIVLRKDEDEWWHVQHQDGRVGSIPVPYVEVIESPPPSDFAASKPQLQQPPYKARALADRQCPYDPTALSFKRGEVITVTKHNDSGVWEGQTADGKRGHFPFTLVDQLDRV